MIDRGGTCGEKNYATDRRSLSRATPGDSPPPADLLDREPADVVGEVDRQGAAEPRRHLGLRPAGEPVPGPVPPVPLG
jgi:hypothetical protein